MWFPFSSIENSLARKGRNTQQTQYYSSFSPLNGTLGTDVSQGETLFKDLEYWRHKHRKNVFLERVECYDCQSQNY